MTKRKIVCLLFCSILTLSVYSQKTIQADALKTTNLGDGRVEYSEIGKNKPLSGTYKIIDGNKSEYLIVDFKKGLNDGVVEYYKDGILLQKESYKEGYRDGLRTDYYRDGALESERSFAKGKLDGIFKKYYPDGSLESEKEYKNGQEHGIERKYARGSSEPTVELNFYEGRPDGKQVRNKVSSNIGEYSEVAFYDKGIKTGDFLQTWMNGVVKESGRYEKGRREGLWITNYENGNRRTEITYKEDKPYGEAKSYYKDGSLERHSVYQANGDDKVTKEFFQDSGIVSAETTYYQDIKEGPYKLYYEDGTLREEGRNENGREVYFKQYYKNGQVKEIRQFTGRNGWEVIESYDADGKQR